MGPKKPWSHMFSEVQKIFKYDLYSYALVAYLQLVIGHLRLEENMLAKALWPDGILRVLKSFLPLTSFRNHSLRLFWKIKLCSVFYMTFPMQLHTYLPDKIQHTILLYWLQFGLDFFVCVFVYLGLFCLLFPTFQNNSFSAGPRLILHDHGSEVHSCARGFWENSVSYFFGFLFFFFFFSQAN